MDAGDAPVGGGGDAGDVGPIEDGEIFRLERGGNRGDGGRILRADMASAAAAEAVIGAAGAAAVLLRIDGGGGAKGLPAQLPGSVGHVVGEAAAAQGGHRI